MADSMIKFDIRDDELSHNRVNRPVDMKFF